MIQTGFETVLFLLGTIGLMIHSGFFNKKVRADLFVYYTNLSNAAVLIYFLLRVIFMLSGKKASGFGTFLFSDNVHFVMMMGIMLTNLIFHFMLKDAVIEMEKDPNSLVKYHCFDNFSVHYIVPFLTLIDWLIWGGKSGLSWRSALIWTLVPLVYTVFVFIHARLYGNISYIDSPYPYPFMDPQAVGMKKVILNIVCLWAGCGVLGILFVYLGKLWAKIL